jgi:hypothetical protein
MEDLKGSFGIVMKCGGKIILKINNRIPNVYEEIHSHRSECFGMLICIQIILKIHGYMNKNNINILPHKILLCCDNKSAINTIKKSRYRKINLKEQLAPNMDLIKGITNNFHKVRKNNGLITFQFIESHQDKMGKKLSEMAELNVKADQLATEGLTRKKVADFQQSTDKASLYLDNNRVTSHYSTHIRDKYSAIQMHDYYQETYGWNNNTLQTIWWDAQSSALQEFSNTTRTSIQKYIHKRIACNERESCFYEYRKPYCHLCSNIIEDHCHLLQCNACPKRKNLRKKYISDLKDKLYVLGTNHDTTRLIVANITAWLLNQDEPSVIVVVPNASKHLKQANTEQKAIGWNQWFRGRLSTKWGDLYNHDITTTETLMKFPSSKKWGKDIVKLTLTFVMDSWYARNICEHEIGNDSIGRSKEKIVDEIEWLIEKKIEVVPNKYKIVSREELLKSPRENLRLMSEQLKKLQTVS